jgi:hypothetical protein
MGRKKLLKPVKVGFKRNVEIFKCSVCGDDTLKKTQNQKYCCKCNGLMNREVQRVQRQKRREAKEQCLGG